MIRSFDYAAITAVRQITEAPGSLAAVSALAETWRQRAVDGFRAAYRRPRAARRCIRPIS